MPRSAMCLPDPFDCCRTRKENCWLVLHLPSHFPLSAVTIFNQAKSATGRSISFTSILQINLPTMAPNKNIMPTQSFNALQGSISRRQSSDSWNSMLPNSSTQNSCPPSPSSLMERMGGVLGQNVERYQHDMDGRPPQQSLAFLLDEALRVTAEDDDDECLAFACERHSRHSSQ